MAAERSPIRMTDVRIEQLEKRARWQRAQLREDLSDLRFGIYQAFDARRLVRKHLWQSIGTVSLIGVIAGYWFAGFFARKGQ